MEHETSTGSFASEEAQAYALIDAASRLLDDATRHAKFAGRVDVVQALIPARQAVSNVRHNLGVEIGALVVR